MGDLVRLPKREPMMWVYNCGCSSFELLDTGDVRCALCQTISTNDGGWHPAEFDKIWDGDEPIRQVSGNNDEEFAKRVTVRRAQDSDVCLIAVLKRGGSLSVWSDMETEEQRVWADERLSEVKNMLEKGAPNVPSV